MLPPVPVHSESRSRENTLGRSLAWQSQTEVGSKEFRGKRPTIEMDALDGVPLLAWNSGEWTQASEIAKDEPPYSEPSVFSLDVN